MQNHLRSKTWRASSIYIATLAVRHQHHFSSTGTLIGSPRLVKWVLTSLVKRWYFWGCPPEAHSSTFFPILTIPTILLVMNCVEGPYHTDSVYNVYNLLCIYCLELELQRACASVSFSPSASKSGLSISYAVKMIPRISLPFGSRGYKYVLSMAPSQHQNSFCSQNIHCNDSLAPG